MLLDKIAGEKNIAWSFNSKWPGLVAEDKNAGLVYLKPSTYMNNSGEAVARMIAYYKLWPKRFGILKAKDYDLSASLNIIHDEIDLPLGRYKISENSRSAGHRGVDSVFSHLKTRRIRRLRIGIMGEKPAQMPVKNYVLARFKTDELKLADDVFTEIIKDNII